MDWKKYVPYAVSVILLALISLLFCSPVMQGKRLVQSDIVKNIAQGKETRDFREATGEEALWTTRVFSGMTTFHIGTRFATNITMYLDDVLREWLPRTANVVFVSLLGFFILLVAFGVNPWLALSLSIAYGLSTNLISSITAGHVTKVLSIAYMAPAIGGVVLSLRGKKVLGSILALIFISLMIQSNHLQILYYFLLICLIIGAVYLVHAIREKSVAALFKNVGLLVVAALLAVLPNSGKMYNAYVHSDDTIRGGKSELSAKAKDNNGGLDREYAMRWSYAPLETMTLVVPSFMGGASTEALPEGGNVDEALKKFRLNKQQKESFMKRAPMYIGDQPFVLGTVYFGAGFIFLFVLALFIIKGRTRSWIVGSIILSLIISWGHHIGFITGLLFDYFPLYNKFRTPSMALAIAGLGIPLLGGLGLHKIFSGELDKDRLKQALKMSLYVTGGLMVLLLLYGLINEWIGPNDLQYRGENQAYANDELYEALLADRKGRYLSDWFVSAVIMALTATFLWMYKLGKLKPAPLMILIAVIFGGDMWRVSKRYLNEDNFVSEREFNAQFMPSPADQSILQDKDPHYRVLNVTLNPWTDGGTCYLHRNIGGHHAAKLQRYQDLIEGPLSSQLQKLNGGLMQNEQRIFLNPQVSKEMPVYNMLNAKYYIVQENNPGGAVLNGSACGNAWFVSEIRKAANADEEVAALNNFDPLQTAVVSAEFEEELYDYTFGAGRNASITLTENRPNYMKYTSSNSEEGLAVFSEIYYSNGWEATIDNEPADIYRVNYVLRAMKLPAGEHTIEMRFKPASYPMGIKMSLAGSVLFVLFAAGLIYFHLRKREEQ